MATSTIIGSFARYIRIEGASWNISGPQVVQNLNQYIPQGVSDSLLYKEKSSVKTPGYRALVRSGSKLPENAFLYQERQRTLQKAYIFSRLVTGSSFSQRTVTYGEIGWLSSAYIFAPKATYSLNSRLISKMKGEQWNVPIFFAEASKTRAMVVQRATHLAHLVNSLRKGDIVSFVRGLHNSVAAPSKARVNRFRKEFGTDAKSAAANMWLEARYGWIPFMKDVHDAVMTVQDTASQPVRMRGSVRASVSQSGVINADNINLFDSGSVLIKGNEKTSWKESQRAVWRFTPNAADLPARFGLVNPLEVAWELVPFSFVVDWFVPIGDYLSALDVPLRVSHDSLSKGTRRSSFKEITGTYTTANPSSYWISGWDGHAAKWFQVDRAQGGGIPTLRLADIPFKHDLGTNQVWSSLALLWQQVSRLGSGKGKPFPYRNR